MTSVIFIVFDLLQQGAHNIPRACGNPAGAHVHRHFGSRLAGPQRQCALRPHGSFFRSSMDSLGMFRLLWLLWSFRLVLFDHLRHGGYFHLSVHILSDRDYRRQAAASDTVHGIQAKQFVRRGLAFLDLQFTLQSIHQQRSALDIAGGAVADVNLDGDRRA